MLEIKEYPFLRIQVDEISDSIIMTWNGHFTSSEYREATKSCVAIVAEHNIKNWLADARLIDEIRAEDHEWTNENVLVPISNLGVKKVAIIMPESVYNHLAISSIMVKGKSRFKFESSYFVHKKEALDWFSRS